MNPRLTLRIVGFTLILLTIAACKGLGRRTKADLQALWNFEATESLVFSLQAKEREFSALAADSEALYLISERAGRILRLASPIGPFGKFEEMALWGREGVEYEGAALLGEHLYLVDERADRSENVHPLLVKVPLQRPDERVAAFPIRFKGLDCQDGRCLEGLAIVGGTVYLLDERDRLPGGGCVGRLYATTLNALEAGGLTQPATADLPLLDCDWRYTGLHPLPIGGLTYLLALKTRCSWNEETKECEGDEYVVELLNPVEGPKVVSSYRFSEVAVSWWRMANVSRNLEGIAVGPDGALYLVSDNRWDHGRMPKILLLRVPKR